MQMVYRRHRGILRLLRGDPEYLKNEMKRYHRWIEGTIPLFEGDNGYGQKTL